MTNHCQPSTSPGVTPTSAQRAARDAFDLDAAMAALPKVGSSIPRMGAAGRRPCADTVADVGDGLLREMAYDSLGAKRCSVNYLAALRVVLGNQAQAERLGYVLELNQRNDFATDRVMRTIITQMREAGITWSYPVYRGGVRTAVVQCVGRDPSETPQEGHCRDLETIYRRAEALYERGGEADVTPTSMHDITLADIPY